jgi:hypothetical protein
VEVYVYEGHLGGFYTSDEELEHDVLYCDSCGDSDQLVATLTCKQDVKEFFGNLEDWYDKDYVAELQTKWEGFFDDNRG